MPFWIRAVAAFAIAAFLLSSFGGLLGADGWWQAAGLLFAVASAVVYLHQQRQQGLQDPEPEDASEAPQDASEDPRKP